MTNIRRQSIVSSIVIYAGFAVGMLNVYFFTKQGLFTSTEYGLTAAFIAICTMMQALASFGMPTYIFKFHPYYSHHLQPSKNDMASLALLTGIAGFAIVMLAGWLFKDLVIQKFSEHSALLVEYYYWIFPMAFGLTIYTILESYTWSIGKPVLTSFLKEVLWRVLQTAIILLLMFHVIKSFDLFIKLYAMAYPVIAVTLLLYLISSKKIHFVFTISKVTRRYFRKIVSLCFFVYSGTIIFTLSQIFDTIVIAAVLPNGLQQAAIFGLAQNMTSIIQAPQRGIIAAAIPHLSKAWKDKNLPLLQKIYQRSSINLLLFAGGLFLLIMLNYTEAIVTLGLKQEFLLGFNAFLVLGVTRVVDLGTGLNTQIIVTSNYWRFELASGIVLLIFILPLTYVLAKQLHILGPPVAALISGTVYNLIRVVFLWKKFRLQPFSYKTITVIVWGSACYAACYFLFRNIHGLPGLFLRSIAFIVVYGAGVVYFKISPDVLPVWATIKKRIGIRGTGS
ncbi:MAG: oligosaccharide flippase family protein [Chitinophagaceae bacterium]|nr:oligosaccharide flippase family protein [Chitinophagaceae bacterium]